MAKLTSDSFKTNLKEGKYSSAGGARKALGKAQEISKAEKASLASAIDKHFGASPAPAKAAVATKDPVAPKKVAAKKTARKASAKSGRTAAKKTTRASKAGGASSPGSEPRDGGNELVDAARDLITQSVHGLGAINAISKDGVFSVGAIEALQDNIVHGTKVLSAYVTQLENAGKEQQEEPAPPPLVRVRASRSPKSAPEVSKTTNGLSDKSAQDFEDSLPGAAEA